MTDGRTTGEPLLEVAGLTVTFPSEEGRIEAVRGVDYTVAEGEVLAIVGESGSGKSVSALAVMGLLPEQARISGSIRLRGRELLGLGDRQLSKLRGRSISMVFQDPLSALTPVYRVGDQVAEALLAHGRMGRKEAAARAVELLELVGIPDAAVRAKAFPHEFSGGMRQRVMIAMAIANDPALIICDEPTTALDVTIQAQILDLMRKLNKESGTAIMLITHDLGVVAEMCDRVVVMYAGKVVEEGAVREIFRNPQHPYTKGLLQSVPRMDQKRERLYSIPGNVPSPGSLPKGCRFAPRCEHVAEKCHEAMPELVAVGDGHKSRCWLQGGLA